MRFLLSSPPVKLRQLARPLRSRVGGTVVTTKREVLNEAEPIDRGVKSLSIDMASSLDSYPEEDWKDGCKIGFSDAYVRGFHGLGGISEPKGPPAYVAGYRNAFSNGQGYYLGQRAQKRGAPSANYEMNEDPAVLRNELKHCQSAYDAWILEHPQKPGKPIEADLQMEFWEFHKKWNVFYTSLHDLGVLDSGDAAIEQIRRYHSDLMGYIRRFEALGYKASFVPSAPKKPEDTTETLKSVTKIVSYTAVGALGYFVYKAAVART